MGLLQVPLTASSIQPGRSRKHGSLRLPESVLVCVDPQRPDIACQYVLGTLLDQNTKLKSES
jgi:hypothetical protein